jgi:hypothetical protein
MDSDLQRSMIANASSRGSCRPASGGRVSPALGLLVASASKSMMHFSISEQMGRPIVEAHQTVGPYSDNAAESAIEWRNRSQIGCRAAAGGR